MTHESDYNGATARAVLKVSPDAASRLHAAREWLASQSADAEIILVTHSSDAARDLHLDLLRDRSASFGLQRFTLNVLAARFAQHSLANSGAAPASNLSFTAIVARAIHSLNSRKKLTYFAPVALRPGFPIAVARTLEELRMNEVSIDRLGEQSRGGADLAIIASLVDEYFDEAKLSDRSLMFRAAIESIDAAENSSLVKRPLLLLDVPVQTKLQTRLVQELASRSPLVFATVPHGDERSVTSLEAALGVTKSGLRSTDTHSSLKCVKQHLFESSAPKPGPLDSSVKLQNWPGEPRECLEIARSIQSEAASGVQFDRMAVLLNSPGEYRAHLEEAFARAEIPAYFVRGTTAPDPSGRALLALLACAAEGLSAKRFAEYLSLGQVPEPETQKDVDSEWVGPQDELTKQSIIDESETEQQIPLFSLFAEPAEQTVIDGSLRTPARWEQLLVDSAVIGGKQRWERRLTGLKNELLLRIKEVAPEEEALVASIKRQLNDLASLQNYALPLIERLASLPRSGTWGEWLAHLRELSVNALSNPEGVIATLAELTPMSSVGPVDLHEVRLVLDARLRDLGVKPPVHRYGRVFVGPVEATRGLSFDVVFVPGLAERLFPGKIVEDPILPDTQRRELGSAGLITRRDQLDVERTNLRLAIGAARTRVYLSYPRIDVQQSRPRVPSFYALEALRAAEGQLPGFEEIAARAESTTRARLGWPAPDQPGDAIDEAEYDLALLANLVESTKQEATGAAHYLLTANEHLARALRGRSRRWLKRWTQNDGLVDPDELAIKSLARHQFSERSFSATALQNFASCPYRFFLSAILRMELRQEPAAIETIDPLTRGSLFHETQFEVLTKLKASNLLPLQDSSLGTAFDLVDSALERLAGEYEDRLAPAIPRVWIDGVNSIRADLREWLRRMVENSEGWVPDKFELSFGLSDRGPRESDPASVDDPVELIGDLKLRGSIDLVERQGTEKYRVTDHKTGKARAERNTVVGGGKHLQPLLYALACQRLLPGSVEAGRLYYCTADGGYEERIVPLNDESVSILNSVLSTIRQGLIDGFLPAAPEKDGCMWCDFLAVCGGFEEKRVSQKPRDRLIQINALRDLP